MKKILAILFVSLLIGFEAVPVAFAGRFGPGDGPDSPLEEGRGGGGGEAAPAANVNNDLKIYYSEPIGAGEKVYHLTSCQKRPSYVPVRCNEETAKKYKKQCEVKVKVGGRNQTKIAHGTIIQACKPEGEEIQFEDGTPWLTAEDVKNFDDGKCKEGDKIKRQSFLYGPEYGVFDEAVVRQIAEENIPDDIIVQGSFGWEQGEDPPQSIVDKIKKGGIARQLYRPTLCATWDVLYEDGPDSDGDNAPEPTGALEGTLLEFYNSAKDEGKELITAGCNNDNSSQAIPGLGRSLPFKFGEEEPVASYTCSLVERITGKSGADLFGRYISALYRWAAGVVGIIAVLIMVYSGIQISMAGGDSAKIEEAKNRIMQSLIGIVLLFLSGLILYTINPGFFTG